ncbi:putative TetR family transcriptional regulator [Actinacidiphila reveromycinica]|uniref:Putative TetR family transcriptional regulator n=1 Tax=Actinacidiphila reveromycinica TaxID=659352 RepID=A0A7U3VM12_9ACTN|nr:TetR family transcriptional regulator [Streptomyces sp. SN-593]BBA96110.1 putative TetR family transcriptional regulator [Streptomyces sp. SN-593]
MTHSSETGSTRRGRPPKGTAHLSRDVIVGATLKVIDADGIAAVSMRSVARTLGVDAKSLYNHVDGKDGLLDAVAEHLLDGIALPDLTGDFATDLRAVADAFRARALLHPEAATLVMTRQISSLAALAPAEALLTVLRGAGCPVGEAVRLLRLMVAALIGTLLREVQAGPTYGVVEARGLSQRRGLLVRSGLPHVAEAAAELARFDREEGYAYAIDAAIDVVVRRVASVKAASGDAGR